MPSLLVLQGIPGSGKTTYAEKYIRENTNTIRVNRDAIRHMLSFWKKGNKSASKWDNEKLVTDIQFNAIDSALRRGHDVISDDTNLNPKTLRRLQEVADRHSAPLKVMMMSTPLDICIERDANREDPVGETVIREMAGRYNIGGTNDHAKKPR